MEVGFVFLVASGEAAEVFEAREAAFNAIALFVKGLIEVAWLLPVAFGGDNGDRAHALDVRDDGIAVIALVGQHILDFTMCQKTDGLGAVVDLSRGYGKGHRQSLLVGQQMDLRRQTSSGTPQSLVRAPFLRPVAACWCARTIVESIIRY